MELNISIEKFRNPIIIAICLNKSIKLFDYNLIFII